MSTKKPALPPIPRDVSPEYRRFFEALKESIEVWDGKRGNELDQVVTVRSLIGSGMAQLRRTASGLLNDGVPYEGTPNIDFTIPPPITGLEANGAFSAIFLAWDQVNYTNLSHVEVWRSATDDLGTAVLVGSTSANVFMDYVGDSDTFYYWVRPVTTANVKGAFNATAGTAATTADDPAYLLEILNESISESQLAGDLSSRINLIDGDAGMAGSVAARIATEKTERISADNVIAQSVTQLTTAVDGNVTTIEQQATSINGLQGQYSIKIDSNGYVAGYGLSTTSSQAGQSSLFLVNADRFAIGHPSAPNSYPFIVDNGKVFMNTAIIQDATITSAKIQNIAANKLSAGTINVALTLNAATINGGSLNINNKFKVDSQGNTTIRSGTSGARLELVNNVIRVYDGSGKLRVKLGNLA